MGNCSGRVTPKGLRTLRASPCPKGLSFGWGRLAICLAAVAPGARAFAEVDPVMVTVNGSSITRSEVVGRLWKLHGQATVQELVDELLLRQAIEKLKLRPDPRDVDTRLDAVRKQFRDEAAFLARLRETATPIDDIRRQLGEQLVREALVRNKKGVTVTEAELRDYFDRNREALATREQVRIRYILVKTEVEAKSALVAARAGADFATLAAELSIDPSKENGGDLGFVSRGTLQPEAETLAFSLKPGEAGMIRTPNGWHVMQVVERKAAEPADFKKVKAAIRETVLNAKIEEAFPAALQLLRDEAKIERGPAVP